MAIPYRRPTDWAQYDFLAVAKALVDAKSVVNALTSIPYQRRWVESLQQMELKREIAGTSRIEGADFTDRELESVMQESAEALQTRSQRQAAAALATYKWIATLPPDRPIDLPLILDIHRRIVTGADDDKCPPGQTRRLDENVTFGAPRHRGADGGTSCEEALKALAEAIQHEYRGHDPLVQALMAHYHFAAMHPFLDGNGRTARAIEALLLGRAGLRDTAFIAMSNYYYDEKTTYLSVLAEVRERDGDLTPFLVFGLKGIEAQAQRLLTALRLETSKELFRSLAQDLFNRLQSPRRRALALRQFNVLEWLLHQDWVPVNVLFAEFMKPASPYRGLKSPGKAFSRDFQTLRHLKAVIAEYAGQGDIKDAANWRIRANLEWPSTMTETEFYKRSRHLPKARSSPVPGI